MSHLSRFGGWQVVVLAVVSSVPVIAAAEDEITTQPASDGARMAPAAPASAAAQVCECCTMERCAAMQAPPKTNGAPLAPLAAPVPPPPTVQPPAKVLSAASAAAVPAKDEIPAGWTLRLKPGASSFVSNSNTVIGQQDGTTTTAGVNIEGGVLYRRDPHEWRTSLTAVEILTRTPLIDKFVIAADALNFESMYLYYLLDWFGFYGRFALTSHFFTNYEYQADPTAYVVHERDTPDHFVTTERLRMNDPFSPLILKQGVGPFFRPVAREDFSAELMLGAAANEILAEDARIVDDNPATPERDVRVLDDYFQLGPENIARVWGELMEKKVAYLFASELMLPVYSRPRTPGVSGLELLNVIFTARIDLRLAAWMSIGYEMKALRQPLLLNQWQLQNNLLLSLTYAYEKHID